MTKKRYVAIVADADVLIDYAKAAKAIFSLVAEHMCDLYVVEEVLDGIKQLSRKKLRQMSIDIYEPTLEQSKEAARRGGSLSGDDKLCCIVARDNGWACWTNDKPLRRACRKNKVVVIWRLEIMLGLIKEGALSLEDAKKAAWAIHETNPRYVDDEIVKSFVKKARKAKGK